MKFDIFSQSIGKDSARFLHSDWGIYIQPMKSTDALEKVVVSTSLFIFPERVKTGPLQFEEYMQRVKGYISGIFKSAAYIKTLKGLTLQVYLDYSVAMARESDSRDLRALGELVMDAMNSLVDTFSAVEVIGVRNLKVQSESSTFLPSLWRFLPLFDDKVSAMICTDADIPFNSLYLELMKPWLAKRNTTYCFIMSDSYQPSWCSIWAALHRVLSGSVLCPLASLWGAAKKRNKSAGSIEDPKTFRDMLHLAKRDDLAFVVENAALLDGLEAEVMRDLLPDRLPIKLIKNPKAMLDFLEHCVLDRLRQRIPSPVIDKFISILDEQSDILHLTTTILFSTYFARDMPMFRHLARFNMKDKILPIVSGMGFGIDELTLQIPLAKRLSAKDVTLVKATTLGMGLTFQPNFSFTTIRDLDPIFAILQDVLPRQDDKSFVVEAMLRSVLFLRQIQPHSKSTKKVIDQFAVTKTHYYRRVFECAANEFQKMFPQFSKFRRFLDQFYFDETFSQKCLKRFIKVESQTSFEEFIKAVGVTLISSPTSSLNFFVYPSLESYQTIKSVFFKGFFLNIPTLHLFKTVDNLKAQNLPW